VLRPAETAQTLGRRHRRRELRLAGHDWPTFAASFSPDGTRLITASEDATVRIWDLSSGETAVLLEDHGWPVTGAVFSPSGARVANASVDGTARVWDAASGDHLLSLFHPANVMSVAYSAGIG
jgi:WD40 repeat protein